MGHVEVVHVGSAAVGIDRESGSDARLACREQESARAEVSGYFLHAGLVVLEARQGPINEGGLRGALDPQPVAIVVVVESAGDMMNAFGERQGGAPSRIGVRQQQRP